MKAYIFPLLATWIFVLCIFIWAGWLGPPKHRSGAQLIFWLVLAAFWIVTAAIRRHDGTLSAFTVGAIVFSLVAAAMAIVALRNRQRHY